MVGNIMLALLLAILTIGLSIWMFYANRQVRGLKGEFGKGVWSESSASMVDARYNRRQATIGFLLILAMDFLYFWPG